MTKGQISIEIHDTPAAILATIRNTRQQARQAADLIRKRKPRIIYVIGNGTSYYSSLAASYTARQLTGENDIPVLAVQSGDFRYYPPPLDGSEVIIGMSASGEFRDVLAVFEHLRDRCLCIGVTQVPGSSITELAEVCLVAGGGPSKVPVMTKTYASTLTAAHLIFLELFNAPQSYWQGLEKSAEICQQAVTEIVRLLPDIIPQVKRYEHAFYFGAGPGYASALEAALKMKEMALLHAEGSETWEMASGPATLVKEHCLCAAFYTGGEGDESTANTARHVLEWGAGLLEIGPHPVAGGLHIPVSASVEECFSTLSLVPPAAMLAYQLALERGVTPDSPHWRERYHSQGMTHIIG